MTVRSSLLCVSLRAFISACLRLIQPRHSVERIGYFCNPNPVQYFNCVKQSDPNPEVLPKYLIQSGFHSKKTLIKYLTSVINAVWIRDDHGVGVDSCRSLHFRLEQEQEPEFAF